MSAIKFDAVVLVIAVVVLGALLYNTSKNKMSNGMRNNNSVPSDVYSSPSPALSSTEERYASANGLNTNTYGMNRASLDNPGSLLPNDSNSQWAALNPAGNGQLKSVNLLSAGSMIGINTIGSTMKNANLQLRSEPPNPQGNAGPWNQSTIEPDVVRQPLEIGGKM